jgi:hypothetical protein
MKNRKHEKLVLAKIGGWWMRAAVVLAKAVHYFITSAPRSGTSATVFLTRPLWSGGRAAELFESASLAADYCWGQWERITHLPRQLAVPVSSSRHV